MVAKMPLRFDATLFNPTTVQDAAKTAGAKSSNTFQMVPVDQLTEMDGFNVRIESDPGYQQHLAAMVEDMVENGYDPSKPLGAVAIMDGRTPKFAVIQGHTRRKAVLLANEQRAAMDPPLPPIAAVPVLVQKDADLRQITVDLVTENNRIGRPLTMLEQGIVAHRLVRQLGMEVQEAATALGKTPRHVNDVMTLVAAPAPLKRMVIVGQVAATLALSELRANAAEALPRLEAALAKSGKARITPQDVEDANTRRSRSKAQQGAAGREIGRETAAAMGAPAAGASGAPEPASGKARPASDTDFFSAAINYALNILPEGGLDWLRRWFEDGEEDALGELEAHMGQPAGSTNNKTLRVPYIVGGSGSGDETPATEPQAVTDIEVQLPDGTPAPPAVATVTPGIGPEPTVLDKAGKMLPKMMLAKRQEKIAAWVAAGGVRTIGDDGQPITAAPVMDVPLEGNVLTETTPVGFFVDAPEGPAFGTMDVSGL